MTVQDVEVLVHMARILIGMTKLELGQCMNVQDVEVLVHMARRRCMDDKAAVRKAGLQLLEALLMMRARGAGGADVELPTEQDVRALEAATADALVHHLGPHLLPVTTATAAARAAVQFGNVTSVVIAAIGLSSSVVGVKRSCTISLPVLVV